MSCKGKNTASIREILNWHTFSEEDKLYFIQSYLLGWTSEDYIHNITESQKGEEE